jgi:hypothetical protein
MRRLTLATLLLVWMASPVFADGPVATSSSAQENAPQPAAGAPPLAAQSDSAGDERPMVMGACGPTHAKADGNPDHAAHGEVEAGIGTGGYRHIGGTVCQPIGDAGAVTVSVGQTQSDWGYARR